MQKVSVELYTVQMQLISRKEYTVNAGKVRFNIEKQASGVYFVKVGLTSTITIKIVKE